MSFRSNKKIRQGTVVSDKMDKTRVVLIERRLKHSLYKKTIKLSKKYKFHDENNSSNLGDQVKIIECKKISKDKSWRLLEITKKAI